MNQTKFNWKRVFFGLKGEQTEKDKKVALKIVLGIVIIAVGIAAISYINLLSHDWARERLWNGIKQDYREPWFILIILAFLARFFGPSLARVIRRYTYGEKNLESIPHEKEKVITNLPKDTKLQGVESFKSFLWFFLIFVVGMIVLFGIIIVSSI